MQKTSGELTLHKLNGNDFPIPAPLETDDAGRSNWNRACLTLA